MNKSVVVVGAGIGGLVAARQLALDGFAVTVLDAAASAGGCVATHSVAGIRLDSGAESFATRGGTVAGFLTELGLGVSLVSPNSRGAWLQLQKTAAPLPKNALLGIPGVPLATDVRRILGWSGALRAQADRVLPFVRVRSETDLGHLVRRRMGRKVLDRLVAPVVSGVHSAHPDLVDVQTVAPGLTTAMTNQGSLSGAVMSLIARRGPASAASTVRRSDATPGARGSQPVGEQTADGGPADSRTGDGGRPDLAPGSAVGGIDGGMYRLVEALVADCERLGVNLQLGVGAASVRRVPSAEPGAAEWLTVLSDESVLGSHGVVIAAGFRSALALLRTVADSGPKPSVDAMLSGAAAVPSPALRRSPETDQSPASNPLPGSHPSQGSPRAADPSDLARLASEATWPGASVVTLATLVLDAPELDIAPRGTGVLVAEDVTAVEAKALTHATAKWPWLARVAGAGRHVVRLSYGRGGQAPPIVSRQQALRDASVLLGVPLRDEQVVGFALTDWSDSLAFATVGHRARVDELVEAVHGHPALEVCGAWISGTGLAYVIEGAGVKARALAQQLASA